jgi:putative oxidoreductase
LHHAGAIFMQQIQNGLWNCLCSHGIFWVAMFFLIGSGRFGIDYLLLKKLNYENCNRLDLITFLLH